MDMLKKIDIIRERTRVSVKEAREALLKNDGDVVETLIYLEERHAGWHDQFHVKGTDLVTKVKELIEDGNVRRIRIKRGRETILEFPVFVGATIGAISLLMLPHLTALGVLAAMVSDITIELKRGSAIKAEDEDDFIDG